MLKYYKFVIPNGVREVRNPSYGSIEERSLATLGMTAVLSIEEPV